MDDRWFDRIELLIAAIIGCASVIIIVAVLR